MRRLIVSALVEARREQLLDPVIACHVELNQCLYSRKLISHFISSRIIGFDDKGMSWFESTIAFFVVKCVITFELNQWDKHT